jgi:hypothetical protein
MPYSTEGCDGVMAMETLGEADYGRLLERAYRAAISNGKGVASPAGSRQSWHHKIPGNCKAA